MSKIKNEIDLFGAAYITGLAGLILSLNLVWWVLAGVSWAMFNPLDKNEKKPHKGVTKLYSWVVVVLGNWHLFIALLLFVVGFIQGYVGALA